MIQKATFGAGCFWGVEQAFSKLGKTTVGYMGGEKENPTYEDVCTDQTGHVEVVQIKFDPSKVSYEKLLDLFWKTHDPTQLNSYIFPFSVTAICKNMGLMYAVPM